MKACEASVDWLVLRRQEEDEKDVVTDGLGNVYPRRCPYCKQKAVDRIAHGICRCTRCGK